MLADVIAHLCPSLQITKAYVTSRLESVETIIREGLENPLEDKTMVTQQLEQMATIGRWGEERRGVGKREEREGRGRGRRN